LELNLLSVVLVMEQAGLEVEIGLVADLLLDQEFSSAAASLHPPHLLRYNLHLFLTSFSLSHTHTRAHTPQRVSSLKLQ
jgi:hypothetical protein